jgi:hypothetical protein
MIMVQRWRGIGCLSFSLHCRFMVGGWRCSAANGAAAVAQAERGRNVVGLPRAHGPGAGEAPMRLARATRIDLGQHDAAASGRIGAGHGGYR